MIQLQVVLVLIIFIGNGGADSIKAGGGADTIEGGPGADFIGVKLVLSTILMVVLVMILLLLL